MKFGEIYDELAAIAVDVLGMDLPWWEKLMLAYSRGKELGRALVLGPEGAI